MINFKRYLDPFLGYQAPSTLHMQSEQAVLDMHASDVLDPEERLPQHFSLWIRLCPVLYEPPDLFLEQIDQGVSLGKTPLYGRGYVVYGAENLKRNSKVHAVDFQFQGSGFYAADAGYRWAFTQKDWFAQLVSKHYPTRLHRKSFAVSTASLVQRQGVNAAGQTCIQGFDPETYPRYPYGGYVPCGARLEDMQQVYGFVSQQTYGQTQRTALGLEKTGDYLDKGFVPPTEVVLPAKRYVFPGQHPPEQTESVADCILNGRLNLTLEHQEQRGMYASFFYDLYRPTEQLVHIYFQQQSGEQQS